ncbi:MAG: hypothetical protein AAGI11_05085 [Pseudomonadota bacterium]
MRVVNYRASERNCSDFWAVTCLFNPARYPSRLSNYRIFRERLEVPLVCVELAFGDDPFQLDEGAAEILIQVRGGDVMWQKERLLNIGLAALGAECRYVAWLDCDIVFEEPGWAARAREALQSYRLIQPFHQFCEILPESSQTHRHLHAAVAVLEDPVIAERIFTGCGVSEANGSVPGFAWAARRELIADLGLYDRLILGSGDRAFLSAVYGRGQDFLAAYQFDASMWGSYLAWGDELYRRVGGRVGFIDGTAFHLAHGSVMNKRYAHRYLGFHQFDFDPVRDISLHKQGCWQWSTDKPEMRSFVVDYFRQRREEEPLLLPPELSDRLDEKRPAETRADAPT